MDHFVFLLKQVMENKALLCLNNLNSRVGWNVFRV
jgi:hypothetical protein